MSYSDAVQNPNLAVQTADALRSRPIAALDHGERASVAGVAYKLDKGSFAPDDGLLVIAARPAIVGNFPPVVVDPLVPGRWILDGGGGGGGMAMQNRRDHSVNGAIVEFWRSPALPTGGPVMKTQTNLNIAGGYNGGGTGNKAILGHFLPAPGFMLLSDLVSVEYTARKLTPEAVGVNTIPYGNLMVDLTPGSPIPLIVVMTFGDVGNAVPTGVFTNPAPDTTKVVWTPQAPGPTASGNLTLVVLFEGMSGPPAVGLWPIIVPKSFGPPGDPSGLAGGGSWPGSGYRFADILAVYPAARIINWTQTLAENDGGLPKLTVMSGITLNIGSSNNVVQNASEILDWKVNGVPV